MTREDIRRRIQTALNDDPEAPIFRDDATLNATIDEALEVLAEEAPLVKRTYTLPRREGQMLYALPGVGDNIQAPYRVWLPDLGRRLVVRELTDLDARMEQWMLTTGDPWHWTPVDWRSFLIWPVPTSAAGWLEVSTISWPEPLTDDGDEPRDLALSDHEALVWYGEMMGHLLQWNVAQAADLWAGFLRRWGSVKSGADVARMQARFHGRSDRQTTSWDEGV